MTVPDVILYVSESELGAVVLPEPEREIEVLPLRSRLLQSISSHPFNSVGQAALMCLTRFCETGTLPAWCQLISIEGEDTNNDRRLDVVVGVDPPISSTAR